MTRIGKFLRVDELPLKGARTRYWIVYGNTDDKLGAVKWLGAWRQYVFRADRGITFNAGCLDDLSAFLREQNKEHSAALKQPGGKER